MKILQIPLKARLGHFKTNYTTASKLSYDIPTFTAIEGIIGAIVGWSRADYILNIKRDRAKIGIIINSPIQKTVFGINVPNELISPSQQWDKSKKEGLNIAGINQRTQNYTELIIEPSYTILFAHEDIDIYESVREKVLNQLSTYNLYLGSAYCIAEYSEKPSEFESIKEKHLDVKVRSVVDARLLKDGIEWNRAGKMITDNIPYKKKADLTLNQYIQVLYNPMAEPIICSGEFYNYVSDEYVYLFEG